MRSVLVSDSGGTRVKMSFGLLPIQVSSGVGSGLEIKIQGSSEKGRTRRHGGGVKFLGENVGDTRKGDERLDLKGDQQYRGGLQRCSLQV